MLKDQPDKQSATQPDKKLSDEDQAKVDRYLQRGVNEIERKPFRPLLLLVVVVVVLSTLSLLSLFIARTKSLI